MPTVSQVSHLHCTVPTYTKCTYHSMVELEGTSVGWLVQLLLLQAGAPGPGCSGPCTVWLSICKEGDSTTSLGTLRHCSATLMVFPDVQTGPPVFPFLPIASGSATGHH